MTAVRNEAIRVVIVDDHGVVRQGVRAFLSTQRDIDVVAEAVDGATAVAACTEHAPDVALVDLKLPDIDGVETTRQIKHASPRTQVVILTSLDDDRFVLPAMQAGALSYLLKDAAPEDLREAIARVARGETLLQPVSTEPVRARYQFHAQDAPKERFSEREVAILRLLAGGYSNKEIARSLFLAEGTVKNYVSVILEKLDTRDRTRAVLKAITLRVI